MQSPILPPRQFCSGSGSIAASASPASPTFIPAVNPSFRDWLAPNEARRMGNFVKRALVTSLKVMKDTGIPHPDAIITGTCLGCLDYTEKLLDTLRENGEQAFSPTWFMQSTHNTVGSTLGIYTKTHGYNTTYSHSAVSFDLAVLDAWMQMQLGTISTALVGGHEEMVGHIWNLLNKRGYLGVQGMVPCGEVAMTMMLTDTVGGDLQSPTTHLCELAGVCHCYEPSVEEFRILTEKLLHQADLTIDNLSAVMTGINGNPSNDQPYHQITDALFPDIPQLHYKHLFGESFAASALGLYAAAHCLSKGFIPSSITPVGGDLPLGRRTLATNGTQESPSPPTSILLLNHNFGKEFSLILLKR